MSLIKRVFPALRTARAEALPDEQPDALARWRRVLEVGPENIDAHLQVASALEALGRVDEACAELADASRRHPADRRPAILLGRHLFRGKDQERALDHWLDVEDRWPDSVEAISKIGTLLVRLDRADEALTQAEKLAPLDVDLADQLRIKALARLDAYEEAVELVRTIRARRALDVAEVFDVATLERARGNPAKALELVETCLAEGRSSPELMKLATELLVELDRHQEALTFLENATDDSMAPRYRLTRRIRILISMHRFDEADGLAGDALDRMPNDAELLMLHAKCAQSRFELLRAA